MTKLPTVISPAARAVLQQDAQRLDLNIRCNEYNTEWRVLFRFNRRADEFIKQKIRPLVDTDVTPTSRDRYNIKTLRLNFRCPGGCGNTVRAATECRFDRDLVCNSVISRERGAICPGYCARYLRRHGG